jgi:hypothetical protein
MMQDNTPINFYIKHFFINCQIKKLQPIFDTFVPPCMFFLNFIVIQLKLLKDLAQISLPAYGDYLLRRCR